MTSQANTGALPVGSPARKTWGSSLKAQRRNRAYLLVAPAVILIAVMMIYPIVQTIYFSFSKVQLPALRTAFIGFDNFVRIFNDPETGPLVQRTLVWIIGGVALKMALGMAAAHDFMGRANHLAPLEKRDRTGGGRGLDDESQIRGRD